jgi:predicted dehydrogenase
MTSASPSGVTRREVAKAAAAGAILGSLPLAGLKAQGTGERKFKVGLIGCGGRGSGALEQHVTAARVLNDTLNLGLEIQVVAACDFEAGKAARTAQKYGVPADQCFSGADGYRKLIEAKPDVVLMATPPAFRPVHLEACVRGGKHVFFEKPVAVDGPGVRRVIAAGEEAKRRGLTIVAGTQRRHEQGYNAQVAALREGVRGRILGGRVSWCGGKAFTGPPINPAKPEDLAGGGRWQRWVEMSGDHIVEQHVHNLDVANWFLDSHPLSAAGFGFRARRQGGNQYDFFSVDLEYPNGVHIHSMCRQMGGVWTWVGEDFTYEKDLPKDYKPQNVPYAEIPQHGGGHQQEHINMLYSLAKGKELNEARNVAWATATAILARDSAYTGQRLTWADLMENPDSEHYTRAMKPSADDFEKGALEYPKDDVIRIPGKA